MQQLEPFAVKLRLGSSKVGVLSEVMEAMPGSSLVVGSAVRSE